MREYDIRPADIFAEYLRLSARDAAALFDLTHAHERECPACGSAVSSPAFTKAGFPFRSCNACRTLFASPLPPVEQFEAFYRDGESARYWANVFVPRVMESRRSAVVRPRVRRIRHLCFERHVDPAAVLDIGAGHGMFLEEWRTCWPDVKAFAVEPNAVLAERCRSLGFGVHEGVGERANKHWRDMADLITSFEVVEHVPDLIGFIASLRDMLRPGGMAVVTSLGSSGFDIQVLWDKANCICPPSHVNFCSIAGFEAAFKRAGFDSVEVMTPGELDVDIVRNKLAESDVSLSRFERHLLSQDPAVLAEFQQFLARNRLSSHTWVLARKAKKA